MSAPLPNIVVVGGGSAGWMCAAALSSLLGGGRLPVTLIESEQIGTVGVGEATIPDILNFNRMLGIDEAEFMKASRATFKLGIEFVDWGRIGQRYIHPFGGHGADMNGFDFHHYWLHQRRQGGAPIEAYSLCAVAAQAGRFTLPTNDPRSVLSQMRYAYHFDATLYALFLRRHAEARGVRRVEGRITEVVRQSRSGDIAAVVLESGERLEGDLFFDCSGSRALLLGETLGVAYRDWRGWLPCDTALAVPSARAEPLLPLTRATARGAGWQWRIPVQHRTGNGHIYASDHLSEDEATAQLLENVEPLPGHSPRKICFMTGRRETFWKGNCIAIGLAAGFLEPLESTSLYLTQQGISRFISLFVAPPFPQVVRDEYNRLMAEDFEQVRDFIILHYAATARDDSPFWNYCRNMDLPDTLRSRFGLFVEGARAVRRGTELFDRHSWVAVFLGQNVEPKRYDPVVGALPRDQVAHSLRSMAEGIGQAVARMPTHEQFIARYCPAPAA